MPFIRPFILSITIVLSATILPKATSQINSPTADGYYLRGSVMYLDANYNGCIDQLVQMRQLNSYNKDQEEAHYYLAMSTLNSGDDEALDILESFLQTYPSSVRRSDILMSIGDFFFSRDNYPQAMLRYEKVDSDALTSEREEDFTYRMAYSRMMTGNNERALAGFDKLRASAKYNNAALFYTAYIAYSNRDYAKALDLFKKVDKSQEPGGATDYFLSQLYYIQSDYASAFETAHKILSTGKHPQYTTETNRIAGESLFNLGREREALPYLWKYSSETIDPHPSAFYMLGVSEYNSGHYESAIAQLQKATEAIGATQQSAWLYLGHAYVKCNNTDAAIMSYEKAYRLNYDRNITETALYNYIVARMEGGRIPFGNSVALLEDFLGQYPKSHYAPAIQERMVTGYMTDNDYESALNSINAIDSPSDNMLSVKQRILFVLGCRALQSGNAEKAIEYLDEAAETGTDEKIASESLLWAASAQYESEQYDNAISYITEYLSKTTATTNRTLAYYNLGYAQYKSGLYKEALTAFTNAINAKPSPDAAMKADAYNRTGDCLYQQSRFTDAIEKYKLAYDLNPESGDYPLYQMSLMKGHNRDYQGEIAGLDDLINKFSTSPLIPAALLNKAEAYISENDIKNAIATYNELVRDFPTTSYGREGYLQLAITYSGAGDRKAAKDAYKKVIYTYPTSEEARVAVDDLKLMYAEEGRLRNFAEFLSTVPNAPQLEISDLDIAAFTVAENKYTESSDITGLQDYLADYPHGIYEAQTLYYLAESAEQNGQYEEGIEYAARITINHPDSEVTEDAMLIKARCEASQGKGEIALESYRALEERASSSTMLCDARRGIMNTALDLGKYATALTAAERLLSSTAAGAGDMNEVKFGQALALDKLGHHSGKDGSDTLWETLAKDPTDIYGAKSAVYLSESLYKRGEYTRAQKTADMFINANPPHRYWLARGFIILSDILRKQGKEFEADEYLKSLRNNYPGSESDIFRMIDERLN